MTVVIIMVQKVNKSQVDELVSNTGIILKQYVDKTALLTVENRALVNDISKLKTVLSTVAAKSGTDNKEKAEQAKLIFNNTEAELEKMILQFSRSFKNDDIDSFIDELGFN